METLKKQIDTQNVEQQKAFDLVANTNTEVNPKVWTVKQSKL